MLMKWKVVEHKILDYKVVLTFWQSMAIIIFKDHLAYFYFEVGSCTIFTEEFSKNSWIYTT